MLSEKRDHSVAAECVHALLGCCLDAGAAVVNPEHKYLYGREDCISIEIPKKKGANFKIYIQNYE